MVRNFERNGTFFVSKNLQNIDISKFLKKGMVHSSFINRFKKSSQYQYFKILRKKNGNNFERNDTFFVYKSFQKILKISIF